jgi:hypothetical protein
LTFVSDVVQVHYLARRKDARRSLRLAERERFPRAEACHLCTRAAPAKTSGRHYDRSAGVPAGLGQAGAGNARSLARSQEARARAERWRSFAAASAVVERRKASASRWTRAAPAGAEVWRNTRLAAFCFLLFTLQTARAPNRNGADFPGFEVGSCQWLRKTRARMRRENGILFFPPPRLSRGGMHRAHLPPPGGGEMRFLETYRPRP